jgi:hypothetical protein
VYKIGGKGVRVKKYTEQVSGYWCPSFALKASVGKQVFRRRRISI